MHTINQGQIQRYKDTGYTKLVWNASFDGRTCDDCGNLDGTVIDIDSLDVPPMHARCRCTICPLIDSLKPKLTEQEVGAINTYISGDSYKINDFLRTGAVLTPFYKEVITNLDNALSKMPCYSGDLSRSLQFNDEESLQAFLSDYVVGSEVTYPAYTSTKFGDTYNPDGQVQMYILDSSTGRDISNFNQGELEVLYGRNSKFKVLYVIQEKGKYEIYLEES